MIYNKEVDYTFKITKKGNKKDLKPEQLVNLENHKFENLFSNLQEIKDSQLYTLYDKIFTQFKNLKKEDKIFYLQQWGNKIQSHSLYENNFLLNVSILI
jgi:hypothetical protein